jgi:PKD repeat protein
VVYTAPAVTAPVAAFSANTTFGLTPLDVGFTDSSTNTPTNWDWYWGADETKSSDLQNPTHQFTTNYYDIRLWASNSAGGDWENKSGYIVVGDTTGSAFSADVTSGASPLNVTFTDASTGTPNNWDWYWGVDETKSSDEQNPSTTLGTGVYNVRLWTSNVYGGGDWENKTAYITVGDYPTASFTKDKTSGAAPLTVTFDGTYTGTAPLTYLWVFGDGDSTNSTVADPIHTFAGVGTYDVNVTVTNTYGSQTTDTQGISVGVVPTANFTRVPSTAAPDGTTYTFTDTSSGATSWNWTFGDGAYSNLQNPTHQYTITSGNTQKWTVVLNATNSYGSNTKTWVDCIGEYKVVTASFTTANNVGAIPLTVTFTDTSVNNSYRQYDWENNGTWSGVVASPVTHTYTVAGVYSPRIMAYNTWSVKYLVKTNEVNAQNLMDANFTATPLSGYEYLPVQFTDTSTNSPTGWNWTFTNNAGTTFYNTTQNPLRYFVPGLWDITLRVSKGGSPDDTETKIGYLNVSPVVPVFSATNVTPIEEQTITFMDASEGSPSAWNWSFGDGQYSNLQHPTHSYSGYTITYFKLFNVTLTVSKAGVTDKVLTKTNYINVSQIKPTILPYTVNVTSGTGSVPPALPVVFGNQYDYGYADAFDWYFNGIHSTLPNPIPSFTIPGVYTVNYSATNEMGRSAWYNSTYSVLGKAPHINGYTVSPLTSTSYAPVNVTFTVLLNTTHYGTPTAYLWDWGDGTAMGTTNPAYHIYTAGGVYTPRITVTNGAWGSDVLPFGYQVLVPAAFAAPLKWVNTVGATVATSRKNEPVSFVFDTNGTGLGGAYNYDRFYMEVLRLDLAGAWIPASEVTTYQVQTYGSLVPMTTALINTAMPTGTRWNGYTTFTPLAAGNYRGQVRAVNTTNATLYPSSYLVSDISITENPLQVSNVGAVADDWGGGALKIILGVIIIIILMVVPYLITREFNLYIEIFMAALGIGMGYFFGLIDLWVVVGVGIVATIIIFFMNRGGGDGGGESSGGEVG